MPIAFQCPECQAMRRAPDALSGRRVRCPECDALIEVVPLPPELALVDEDEGRDTVALQPTEKEEVSGETVILEAIDLVPTDELPALAPSPLPVTGIPSPPGPAERLEQDEEAPQVKKTEKVETEMDMTPMVDATFQLLIFFMITAAFALQKSKEIPKPKSDEPSTNVVQQEEEETANAVVVKIDEFNSYLVINADGDEEEAPSVVDLHAKLRKAHEGDSEGRVPTLLRVEAHGEALHERVITAIDAGNDVGFAEVELASMEEDA